MHNLVQNALNPHHFSPYRCTLFCVHFYFLPKFVSGTTFVFGY